MASTEVPPVLGAAVTLGKARPTSDPSRAPRARPPYVVGHRIWGAPRIVGELGKIGAVAADFFVVPTARNQILFVFLILAHQRRRVLHFNVTANPTAEWTAQQIVEAFPWDEAPRFLLRDHDRIYGERFSHRVEGMGIEQVVTPAVLRRARACVHTRDGVLLALNPPHPTSRRA